MRYLSCSLMVLVAALCLFKSSEGARGRRIILGRNEYLFSNGNKQNWHGAKDECETIGMDLVQIETQGENNILKDHLENEAISGDYWTAGSDAGRSKNDFVWNTRNSGKRVRYTDFHQGEPNSGNGIALTFRNGQYKWSDESLYNSYMYICEARPE